MRSNAGMANRQRDIDLALSKSPPSAIRLGLVLVILPNYTAYEDGTNIVFRNVGTLNSDDGESHKSKNTTFRTRRKFEIKDKLCYRKFVGILAG